MSTVGNVTLLSPSTTTSTTGSSTQSLTQADFLKLMVAQFTEQDPLSSGSGGGGDGSGASDYVNQLMSMTNLTTMQTMSAQQGVQLAQALPGANVSLTDSSGNSVTGTVEATTITTGAVSVTINGVEYPTSEITSINKTAAQAAAGSTTATTTTGT